MITGFTRRIPAPALAALVGVCLAATGVSHAAVVTVTNFRTDFEGAGWQYLWNAPQGFGTQSVDGTTGAIGDPANYQPLIETSPTSAFFTADGNANPSPEPAGFLRMTPFNGHPGRGSGQAVEVDNDLDRYVIAAYEVSQDGHYGIRNSTLAQTDPGIRVLIHVNTDAPVLDKLSSVTTPANDDFDTDLGHLEAGDTIYVAFGPDDFDTDGFFELNFDIAIIPEPGTLGLAKLGVLLVAARRRRL